MNSHSFRVRHTLMACLFFMVGMIGVGTTCAEEKTSDKGPASQELRKKFAVWRSERDKVEKQHQEFHQREHGKKQQKQKHQKFLPEEYEGYKLDFDTIMLAPDDPELWPLWRDWLAQWRKDKRQALDYDDSYYSDKSFAWVPSNYVSGFAMLWDMTLLDPGEGRYTVKEFIEHGKKEFGGYDSVVLWLAYPILGIGQRNQFDM